RPARTQLRSSQRPREERTDTVGVRYDIERESLGGEPGEDRSVGQVHRAGTPEPALAIAGERHVTLRDEGECSAVVDARAVPRPDRLQRPAAEAAEDAQQEPLVCVLASLLRRARPVPHLEDVRFAAPERDGFPWRRAILVMDAEDGEARHEEPQHPE